MEELTDEQIVKSVINGNEDIYREIIKRYEKKLSRYLCKFINNPEDIEDVLQIIFIKTYKNLYGFNLDKKFSSWIYRISHNEAINYLKKYKNNRICLDDIEYKLIDEKIDIKKETDRIFLKKDIEDALNNIDIKYREPIVLFYLEEMSYDEISDILRIPKNTVGTLILRGKKILKEELSEIKKIMNEKIENKIMDKIKNGQIKLKSKYIFWAEKLGLGTVFTLSIILSILFFNLILFYLKETDNLKYLSFGKLGVLAFLETFPYILVIFFILLTILSGYLITKSDTSYRKPFGQIIIIMISIIIFFGAILTFTNLPNEIENYSMNMNEKFLLPFDNNRERGVSGIIYDLHDDYLILKTPQGLRTVRFDNNYDLREGQFIISVGETKQFDFFAKDIKIIKKEDVPAIGRAINFRFSPFNDGSIPPELLFFNEKEKECIFKCMETNNKKINCFKECKEF